MRLDGTVRSTLRTNGTRGTRVSDCTNTTTARHCHNCDHVHRWQASPSKPAKHRHSPVVRSHSPMFEHSATACACVAEVGISTHALSDGHVPATPHTVHVQGVALTDQSAARYATYVGNSQVPCKSRYRTLSPSRRRTHTSTSRCCTFRGRCSHRGENTMLQHTPPVTPQSRRTRWRASGPISTRAWLSHRLCKWQTHAHMATGAPNVTQRRVQCVQAIARIRVGYKHGHRRHALHATRASLTKTTRQADGNTRQYCAKSATQCTRASGTHKPPW
jgi:hypothetical protein